MKIKIIYFKSLLFLTVLVISCTQNREANLVNINTRVGNYIIILPDNFDFVVHYNGFYFDKTFKLVARDDTSDMKDIIICATLYQTRREKEGTKLDIPLGFLYGDIPNRGKNILLDKEIISHEEYDFYESAFVSFPFNTGDFVNDSEKELMFRSNYVFNGVNFSFTFRKNVSNQKYWDILKDIELMKKIKVIKL